MSGNTAVLSARLLGSALVPAAFCAGTLFNSGWLWSGALLAVGAVMADLAVYVMWRIALDAAGRTLICAWRERRSGCCGHSIKYGGGAHAGRGSPDNGKHRQELEKS